MPSFRYRPDRVRDFDVNLAEYRRLTELDLFLCETMSTAAEVAARGWMEVDGNAGIGIAIPARTLGLIRALADRLGA